MSRRNARKNAFVLLFQMEFNAAEEQEQMTDLFFAEQDEVVTEEDKAYTMAAVEGTRANLEAIDAVIDSFAKGWNTQRMNRVDLAILRLAVYELKYSKDAPVGVVINEAVELAKIYGGEDSPGFINAILGKLVKGLDVADETDRECL